MVKLPYVYISDEAGWTGSGCVCAYYKLIAIFARLVVKKITLSLFCTLWAKSWSLVEIAFSFVSRLNYSFFKPRDNECTIVVDWVFNYYHLRRALHEYRTCNRPYHGFRCQSETLKSYVLVSFHLNKAIPVWLRLVLVVFFNATSPRKVNEPALSSSFLRLFPD